MGASTTVSITVTKSTAGSYTVAVETLSGGFKVTSPPPPALDYTWYIVGVAAVILILVAVWYILRRRPKNP